MKLETEVTGRKSNEESVAEQGVLDPLNNVLPTENDLSHTYIHDESSKSSQYIELHLIPDENTNEITTSDTAPSIQKTSESFAQSGRAKPPGLPFW